MNLLRSAEGLCLQPACFYPQRILFRHHLLHFFWSLLTFPKKSPKQVQQALAPGFLLPFSGQRSTLYIKKPELRKYDLLNPGFLVQNRYLCQSAKDPAIFYFFRISSNFSILPTCPREKLTLMYPVNLFSIRDLITSIIFFTLSIGFSVFILPSSY